VNGIESRSWILGAILAMLMVCAPYQYYRYVLEHGKRLRPIAEGKLYRSGCLSADGFRDAIARYKIKTIISLWDENPDPDLPANRFSRSVVRESELCKSLGVNYRFIFLELLPDVRKCQDRPPAVAEFLKIMDDPEMYPVLIHCKAGLHRTGVMAAVYRMEYEGWTVAQAMRELKSHGFGDFNANRSNPYIRQYVLRYRPRSTHCVAREVQATTVASRKN
jgi:tyrosine-protein phosphatase SIW14